MFDYLQKFNNLPKNLRDKVSSSEAIKTISSLEEKYKIDLAAVVMKIMTKVLPVNSLVDFFINESSLSKEDALSLKNDLLNKVFFSTKDYLGINLEVSENITDFASIVIKETGISLASEDLYLRLRNIILTYLKGVRNKMDTKNSLTKEVKFGGLNLSEADADNIFLAIKSKKDSESKIPEKDSRPDVDKFEAEPKDTESSRDKLNKIIMSAEGPSSAPYSLKDSISNKAQLAGRKPLTMLKENKQAFLLSADSAEKNKTLEREVLSPDNLPVEESAVLKKVDLAETDDEVKEQKLVETMSSDLSKESVEDVDKESVESEAAVKDLDRELVQEKAVVEKVIEKKEAQVERKEFVPSKTLNLNLKRPAMVSTPSRVRIDDIKPVTKILSPIDELRLLDLVNFRRLGSSPKEIVLKVFNKIKLLEKDGYDKMIEGVKAWRQSEVNHLYVRIGQEVIIKNSSYLEIIKQRQEVKMPYLEIEEINAISQLNSKLSF